MARKSQTFVVTRKDDPNFVRVFTSKDEAVQMAGPEYNKKGFVISGFEKKTETYFAPLSDEDAGLVNSVERAKQQVV